MKLSFIIILSHPNYQIKDCLSSLQMSIEKSQSNKLQEFYEIIIGINQEEVSKVQEFKKIIQEFQDKMSLLKNIHVELHHFSNLTPAHAKNLCLDQSHADYICFLNDDIILPPDYVSQSLEIIKERPDIDIFGGPDQTYPQASFIEHLIGVTLQSRMATAHTKLRRNFLNSKNSGEQELVLYNIWVKRSLLEKVRFDERLFHNEENILIDNLRLIDANMKIFPYLHVYHRRPTNPFTLIKDIFFGGFHRAKSFKYYPQFFKLIFVVPSLLILYLAFLPLALLMPLSSIIVLTPLYTYLGLSIFFSFSVAFKSKSMLLLPLIILLQIFINIAYGLGFLFGFIQPKN